MNGVLSVFILYFSELLELYSQIRQCNIQILGDRISSLEVLIRGSSYRHGRTRQRGRNRY